MSRQQQELARRAAHRSGPRINVDWRVVAGQPCVTGTRIPVQTVMGGLASEALLEEYSELTADDVQACLAHPTAVLDLLGDATQTVQVPGSQTDVQQAMDNHRRSGTMDQSTERREP